jgi:hypothetical protein
VFVRHAAKKSPLDRKEISVVRTVEDLMQGPRWRNRQMLNGALLLLAPQNKHSLLLRPGPLEQTCVARKLNPDLLLGSITPATLHTAEGIFKQVSASVTLTRDRLRAKQSCEVDGSP